MALAAVEGVVLGLVRGLRAIEAARVPVGGAVVVTGGGARSPAYRQVLADATGRPVQRRDVDEATARGAAIQAAAVHAGSDVASVRDAWNPGVVDVVEPRAAVPDQVWEAYEALAEPALPSEVLRPTA